MTTNAPRRALLVKIQRQLSSLNTSQLQDLTRAIDDGSITATIDELSDTDLYELIVEHLRSDQLKLLEDEGMSQLLLLDDLITDLLTATAATGPGGEGPEHPQRDDQTLVPAPAPVHPNVLPVITPAELVAPSSPQINELHPLPTDYSPGEDRDLATPTKSSAAPGQTSRSVGPSLSGTGHRAIGCLQCKVSGNATRSRERDSQ
ncbi:uncharacterized protein LOC114477122 [Gouania willdenowi]|uniref:uncharacterized protein LOC114477122 n=1 Tax=Gouania willdenowi TaxID=441366 RepID=UPI001055E1DF|nr:uncharacterized protein LOC114477122 [Gouania willdenowi]